MTLPCLIERRGEVVVLAGRIVAWQRPVVTLADADGAIDVELTGTDCALGELVVIHAQAAAHGYTGRVVQRHAGQLRGEGEHARVAQSALGRHLAARSRALRVLREFFEQQQFVEVDTPLRVPAPGLDPHIEALTAEGGYLITSPEHAMKRLLVGGAKRIYQLSHVFRAEELGPLHQPEFCMLEWYRAFSDVEAVMQDTEELVTRVFAALSNGSRVRIGTQEVELSPPFERMSVRAAFARFADEPDAAALADQDEDAFFQLLVDRVEPGLASLERPVFLCEYPISQAALARPLPADPALAERFELYLGGVELCNGYGELTDASEQRRRHTAERLRRQAAGQRSYPLDEPFLTALEEGMPPSAGNALGVDRLIQLALGEPAIARVVPFPEG